MEERRQKSRQDATELLVACDSNTGALIGKIANICESGVMLLSKNPVSLNTTIECMVMISSILKPGANGASLTNSPRSFGQDMNSWS
jgi:hypothetical protein